MYGKRLSVAGELMGKAVSWQAQASVGFRL